MTSRWKRWFHWQQLGRSYFIFHELAFHFSHFPMYEKNKKNNRAPHRMWQITALEAVHDFGVEPSWKFNNPVGYTFCVMRGAAAVLWLHGFCEFNYFMWLCSICANKINFLLRIFSILLTLIFRRFSDKLEKKKIMAHCSFYGEANETKRKIEMNDSWRKMALHEPQPQFDFTVHT